ncbi:MAG TPA: tail fiber domain-containing protein [Flavitalea sp.]|nr:tail fiber domain-containing protein [Flavitalea sp.]
MRKMCLLFTALLSFYLISAQVAITTDGSAPAASAMLDIKSTSKGLLIPRIALTGINDNSSIVSPVEGLLLYNTATAGGANAVSPGFYYYRLGVWNRLIVDNGNETSPWLIGGNTGIDASNHFLGTNDNKPLRFKVFGTPAGKIDPTLLNIFMGQFSGAAEPSGAANAGYGYSALRVLVGGSRNTALGANAMYNTVNATDNIGVGAEALMSNITGSFNTSVGSRALYANTASYNSALGYHALEVNTSGTANTGMGANALALNQTGSFNTGVGYFALNGNTFGNSNTAIGMSALQQNSTGIGNTGVGTSALYSNGSGNDNTAMGMDVMANSIGTTGNTAMGARSMVSNNSGSNNTAVGMETLMQNISGGSNTAIGSGSLFSNTTGSGNTATGFFSLRKNTTGYNNIAVGRQALPENTGGFENAAMGFSCLPNNTTGYRNTSVGLLGLWTNQTGSNNTSIGFLANVGAVNLFNATAIGSNAQADCNSCLVLGSVAGYNSAANDVNVGIGTTNPTSALRINANSVQGGRVQLHLHESANDYARITMTNTNTTAYWDIAASPNTTNPTSLMNFYFSGRGDVLSLKGDGNAVLLGTMTANGVVLTSDERFKKNITPIDDALEKLTQLTGYHYYWKDENNDQSLQSGVIAQEVEKIFPELVKKDEKGMLAVNYSGLTPYLIQSIKEQQQQITTLKNENEEIRKQLNALKEAVEKIQR